MNKFTKSMAAIAVSAVIAGPAAATEFDAGYAGTDASIKFSGDSCDKDQAKNLDIAMEFINGIRIEIDDGLEIVFDTGPYTGIWQSALFSFGEEVEGEGTFIITKPGKTSLDAPKMAGNDVSNGNWVAMKNAMEDYASDNCKNFDFFDDEMTTIKKFDTKWSKDGEVAKVKLDVEGKYENTDGKDKKIKLSLKSGNMDNVFVD